ncbi:MAG: hypothetical protein FWC62_03380 [Firmicutes bacterium]|nr:hypothetical protein [Bacillota bacterium]
MAVMKNSYPQKASVFLNIIYDIAEMRKANVTRMDHESLIMDTEMYGIKTEYLFHIVPAGEGTTVTVETEKENDDAQRGVRLMFATLENALSVFDFQNSASSLAPQ